MIVDTSALVAVHEGEVDGAQILEKMRHEAVLKVSAGTLLEASIVLDARQPTRTSRRLDRLIADLNIQIVPVDDEHVRVARAAYRDFGRGSGHPAGLNLGDCFAYALASITGEPLLFKGDDFAQTDVRPARPVHE
jgi:ribonuclease VapC